MKILSKYKDYYDYLIAKYGIDEKVVLDRTKFDNIHPPGKGNIISIYFCDYKIEGISLGDRVIYGEEILQYYEETQSYKFSIINDNGKYHLKYPKGEYGSRYKNWNPSFEVLKAPVFLGEKYSPNRKYNCPILVGELTNSFGKDNEKYYSKYPILERFNFHKVFPAEDAYIKLYEWLTKEKPMIEIADKHKIESHGFDKVTSFRKM